MGEKQNDLDARKNISSIKREGSVVSNKPFVKKVQSKMKETTNENLGSKNEDIGLSISSSTKMPPSSIQTDNQIPINSRSPSVQRNQIPSKFTNTLPTTSKHSSYKPFDPNQNTHRKKKCWEKIYDKEKKEYCGRNCRSWLNIVMYSLMYIIFLSTFTLIFLYGSLIIVKEYDMTMTIDKAELMTFKANGIGLTAIPLAEDDQPVIWYRNNANESEYKKYTDAISRVLSKSMYRRDLGDNFGPCGTPPYGYGSRPCVYIKVNKQRFWHTNLITEDNDDLSNSAKIDIPKEVKFWKSQEKNKLWLHCNGFHQYDKEHLKSIKYYPDPPGFDINMFSENLKTEMPMIAVQFYDFTTGLSIVIECKLFYKNTFSAVQFLLYVAPESAHRRNIL